MSSVVLAGGYLSGDFHDIELELVRWTLSRLGAVVTTNGGAVEVGGAGNRTPANLDQLDSFVRWMKTGGTETVATDYPVVECDVFAAQRNDAYAIASAIRTRLVPRTRLSAGGAIIDLVRVRPTPRELPWDNPKVKRIGATYSLGLRR